MSNGENDRKRYLIVTFGCQMNEHDSEIMAGLLEAEGYTPANGQDDADVILFNTCCVREKAENRVWGQLGNMLRLKRRRPNLIIGVAGCMAQRPGAADEFHRRAPQVDLLVGTHEETRLPELLRQVRKSGKPVTAVSPVANPPQEGVPHRRSDRVKAWVTISLGCSNFCSYCTVPYVRGPERSRSPEAIIEEVRSLADQGFREVMLLGQNVNTYGRDLETGVGFSDLLKRLDRLNGPDRIRYTTSHPRDFSLEMVDVIAGCTKVCEHFHLPVQAGSNRILKMMRRGYTREHYLELAQAIRERIPGCSITTDIIVGFPGETDEDFEATMDLVRQVRFDAAYTFIYSPRPGTAAADLPDRVPPEVVQERFLSLNRLQDELTLESNRRLQGQVVEVLVEGTSKNNPDRVAGRTRTNKLVVFPGKPDLIGWLVAVHIDSVQTFNLLGSRVEEGARR